MVLHLIRGIRLQSTSLLISIDTVGREELTMSTNHHRFRTSKKKSIYGGGWATPMEEISLFCIVATAWVSSGIRKRTTQNRSSSGCTGPRYLCNGRLSAHTLLPCTSAVYSSGVGTIGADRRVSHIRIATWWTFPPRRNISPLGPSSQSKWQKMTQS